MTEIENINLDKKLSITQTTFTVDLRQEYRFVKLKYLCGLLGYHLI